MAEAEGGWYQWLESIPIFKPQTAVPVREFPVLCGSIQRFGSGAVQRLRLGSLVEHPLHVSALVCRCSYQRSFENTRNSSSCLWTSSAKYLPPVAESIVSFFVLCQYLHMFVCCQTLRDVRLGPAVLEAGALLRKAAGRSHT